MLRFLAPTAGKTHHNMQKYPRVHKSVQKYPSVCKNALHQAAEMVCISVLHFHLKVKGSTDPCTAGHTGKVDGGNALKFDVDSRFVHKDEAFVQGVEEP